MALAQSQATTGLIEGTVSDASGARLPGATVTLLNTGTNATRDLVTDSDGRFRGLLLPLGTYRLTVVLTGFSTYTQEGIELVVGQTANIPIVLQLASVQEMITVTSDSPVVETTRAEQSTLINQKAISGLPNNGRNFLSFMQLTPGVTIVQGPDGDEISVNGQKGINNNIAVDGADFNNPFFGEQRGGQRPAFTFNQDAVKEMVVVADGAAPEFGRSGAGFINVVTKSGTNAPSGSAHFFFKADCMSTKNSAGEKFPYDQQQYGATFGGPLKKDRVFFFLAYDEQQFDQTKQLNPNRIEPRVVQYFASLGSPDENGTIDRTNDARVFLGKVDYQVSQSNLFTIRYNYTWSEQQNGTFDVDSWGRSANAVERGFSNAVSGSLATTLSGTMLNELRFQFAREDRPRPYGGPNVGGQTRPFPDTAFDFVSGYRFGEPFFIPVEYNDTRFQIVDSVSWIKGRHTLKAGFELNRVNSSQTFVGFANGRYVFGSTQGFLNYAQLGPRYVECSDGSTSVSGSCPAGASISGPLLLYLQQAGVGGLSVEEAGTQDIPQVEPALFIQDKWQPNAHLTVSYGVRWEAQIEPDLITPRDELFYREFLDDPAFPSDGTIPSDKKMWQPRLGVSWDPGGDGKQVVRASAGIFYARIPGLNLASTRSTDGTRGQTLYRDSTFNGFGLTPPTWPNLIPQSQIASPDHPDVFVFDKNFQNPRTYSTTLSYEREMVTNLSVFATFTHSKTVHITRFINRNDPVFGRPFSTGLGADNKNGIGTLTTVESSAKSKYDAFTVGMNKRYAQNYQFQWNYTIGRDMSDDDNERDPFSFRYAKADNLAPEYNYSDRDQRHRFNAWLLVTAKGFDFNTRISSRTAQPGSVGATPQSRIQPDGSIIKRNTLRKDNEFFTWDFRVGRPFQLTSSVRLEPVFEVFNLTNSENIRRPSVTNLIFSFDGTVQNGLGEPRQAQLGVRVRF
jgi:hypothetical protein